ncbi:MAG: MraY family glycosyltransferase [Rectinemataceae bacterium]|nr:MraY family glycosyltransferase [Rectinemataceae bacterium]
MITIAFLLSGAIAAAIMPAIIAYAAHRGLFDIADQRKVHRGDISRLGGVAVFVSFVTTIAAFAILANSIMVDLARELRYLPVMAGLFSMFILGLVDDLHDLRARTKLCFQLAAAALVVVSGFRFSILYVPFGDGRIEFGIFSWPLTMMWIIGVTNAMNLIDGIDGLLGGITAIASATFGFFFLAKGEIPSSVICFALCGAAAGFLLYNFPEANIFMGDAGALFIGFTLAVLPLLSQSDSQSEIGLLPAIAVLGIPILDTLAAIWRRTKQGVHFFTPDRGHLHHMFLELGFSVWKILGMIYSTCVLLAVCALSSLFLPLVCSFLLNLAGLGTLVLLYFFLRIKTLKNRKSMS